MKVRFKMDIRTANGQSRGDRISKIDALNSDNFEAWAFANFKDLLKSENILNNGEIQHTWFEITYENMDDNFKLTYVVDFKERVCKYYINEEIAHVYEFGWLENDCDIYYFPEMNIDAVNPDEMTNLCDEVYDLDEVYESLKDLVFAQMECADDEDEEDDIMELFFAVQEDIIQKVLETDYNFVFENGVCVGIIINCENLDCDCLMACEKNIIAWIKDETFSDAFFKNDYEDLVCLF